MRRLLVLLALLVGLIGILPAVAVAADDIPGTPLLLGQTVTGTLDSKTKEYDVYSIDLTYGQEIELTVHNLPNHTGNTMYLMGPTSTSIHGEHQDLASAGTYNDRQTGTILYTPAVDGTYFVSVSAGGHNDTYDLTVAGSAERPLYPTSVYIRSSKGSVSRGGSVVISGSLADQNLKPLLGRSVEIERSYDGKNWMTVRSTDAANGRYALKVALSRSTWFRTSFAGDADYAGCSSRALLVKVK